MEWKTEDGSERLRRGVARNRMVHEVEGKTVQYASSTRPYQRLGKIDLVAEGCFNRDKSEKKSPKVCRSNRRLINVELALRGVPVCKFRVHGQSCPP